MIEILKKGTKKKVTCRNCGAILTYENEDVKRSTPKYAQTTRLGDYLAAKAFDYIICPQCEHKIDV